MYIHSNLINFVFISYNTFEQISLDFTLAEEKAAEQTMRGLHHVSS